MPHPHGVTLHDLNITISGQICSANNELNSFELASTLAVVNKVGVLRSFARTLQRSLVSDSKDLQACTNLSDSSEIVAWGLVGLALLTQSLESGTLLPALFPPSFVSSFITTSWILSLLAVVLVVCSHATEDFNTDGAMACSSTLGVFPLQVFCGM